MQRCREDSCGVKEVDEKISNETPGGSTVLMSAAAVSAAYRNEISADVPRNLETKFLGEGYYW